MLLTRLPRMFHLFYSFLIIIPLLGVFYLLCLKLGFLDLFQSLLFKSGFSLGSRVLSFALFKLGLAGGLARAIGFLLRLLFSSEEIALFMFPPGADASSSSNPQAASPYTSSKWSGSWIDRWLNPENASSAPRQPEGEVNQPIQPQPPAAGPSEPIPCPAPVDSPLSLSLSNQEWLSQFLLEEGTTVEQQPGAPEAMPQAPAPTVDTQHLLKTSIIQRMGELYPKDPWDPQNALIKTRLFPGGKGKTKIRPMTIAELEHIEHQIIRHGKKAYWAKELHRRIRNWDWQNPRGPS